jgi:hypothetical protein
MVPARVTQSTRVWNPPQSSVRIEFSDEFLRQVQREGGGEKRGILYGRRTGAEAKLLAARSLGHARDLRLLGLEHVGMFAVRRKGEVFLTEHDLIFAERLNASVVLVVAGKRAGFFVREPDGSMQVVRSLQEFRVPESEIAKKPGILRTWLSAVFSGMFLIGSLGVVLYAQPRAPLTLNLREQSGQLVIRWSHGVLGTLDIINNRRVIQLPVSTQQLQAVFQADPGTVQVRLTPLDGSILTQGMRFGEAQLVAPVAASAQVQLQAEIARLEEERQRLEAEAAANNALLAKLEQNIPEPKPAAWAPAARMATPKQKEPELLFFK